MSQPTDYGTGPDAGPHCPNARLIGVDTTEEAREKTEQFGRSLERSGGGEGNRARKDSSGRDAGGTRDEGEAVIGKRIDAALVTVLWFKCGSSTRGSIPREDSWTHGRPRRIHGLLEDPHTYFWRTREFLKNQ